MPAAKQEAPYDVFISYRRGAADELALLVQKELERHGLAAFLDRDLRHGTFDDALLRRIANSLSFLILLTPGALDHCSNDDDWLRKEITQALKSGCNIIPLQIDSFQFTPELVRNLDPDIKELSRYQAVEYSRAYLESMMERIVKIVEEDKAERRERQATEERRKEKENSEVGQRAREKDQKQLQKLGIAPISKFEQPETTQRYESQEQVRLESAPAAITRMAVGTVKMHPKDGQTYVWIPPGTFRMGCSSGDSRCYDDEEPAHSVTITKGFWLGQTPVTQATYHRLMRTNPSGFRGHQLPVECVTWSQAKEYCEAAGGRLPTEAEWEYAARAGTITSRYGEINAVAWYHNNSGGHTHEVGQKQANAWNLYDMLGNISEWVEDWYDAEYYKKSPIEDPKGPVPGQYCVIRGGSWDFEARDVRSSDRGRSVPTVGYDYIGFRCVREVFT